MPLDPATKGAVANDFATHDGDTGSPEVQIALLTERIKSLTDHLRSYPNDNASRSSPAFARHSSTMRYGAG